MVGCQRHAPTALPPGMTRYPLYMRMDRPQGRSGRVRKISPHPFPFSSFQTDYSVIILSVKCTNVSFIAAPNNAGVTADAGFLCDTDAVNGLN